MTRTIPHFQIVETEMCQNKIYDLLRNYCIVVFSTHFFMQILSSIAQVISFRNGIQDLTAFVVFYGDEVDP